MANLIVINDIIGLGDSSVDRIREQLNEFQGQPTKVEINSPGGFVFEGLEIFHMFKNYIGFVHMHVMSMAASMASVIPLAGNRITAEESTVWFIHNVIGGTFGDFRELRKESNFLEGARNLLANIFSKRMKMSVNKIKNLMDDETSFFGDESLKAGLVDEIILLPENKKETRNDAIEYAKMAIVDSRLKMKEENRSFDSEKAAAWLKIEPENNTEIILEDTENFNETDFNNNVTNKPAESGKKEVSKTMITLETLKNENPDLYKSIMQAGIDQERVRTAAHLAWIETSKEAVLASIKNGDEFSPASLSIYSQASLNMKTVNDAISENSESVSTETPLDDEKQKETDLLNQTMALSKKTGGK